MQNKPTTTNKEIWQKGYISNKTQLNVIDLSKCDKSKITVYGHTKDNTNRKK
jgi:hypothetical protein